MSLLGLLLQVPAAEPKNHSVSSLIFSADPVVKITLLILVIFSVFSWAIILYKFLQMKKAKKTSAQFIQSLENVYSLDEALTKTTAREGNPAYEVFSAGLSDIIRYRQMNAKEPGRAPKLSLDQVQRKIQRSAGDQIEKLELFTPFLATTASASPFIGLFGTVWGILTAFYAIGKSGSTSLATVGPFISEALIATAVGLAAAIPAVVAYNYFVVKIKAIAKMLEDFSGELYHRIEKEYF
ncbi:MAG: MotA/TolQ/ExbB proton channel family protein [Deltaproteobacteria bacterium]|nr:MotA/TolQ/ExbB proton channel family protein [Deltaproteobacteria bacterium]